MGEKSVFDLVQGSREFRRGISSVRTSEPILIIRATLTVRGKLGACRESAASPCDVVM